MGFTHLICGIMTHYILAKFAAKRLEQNYSPEYMAACLNITPQKYMYFEKGEIDMSIKMMHDILGILDMEVCELFNSTGKIKRV